MTKEKVSATVDPDRLAEAVRLAGTDNVSAVIDSALQALIDREKENIWLTQRAAPTPGAVTPDLSDLPWDD